MQVRKKSSTHRASAWRSEGAPPTCIDDDAHHCLCVPDGAAAQQQVLLVQSGLLSVAVDAVGRGRTLLDCTWHPCLNPHCPGEEDAGTVEAWEAWGLHKEGDSGVPGT